MTPTGHAVRGRQYVRLLKAFTYEVGSRFSGITVTVPIDYESDFASIPPIFWPLLPPMGKYAGATVIHDWLYSTNGVSRVVADAISTNQVDLNRSILHGKCWQR